MIDVDAGEPSVVQLGPDAHAFIQPPGTWWVNNAGFVVGDDDVLLIDTCATEQRTRALLDAISDLAPHATIRMLVNTHHHGDHTYGNCLVGGVPIIASGPCRELAVATGIHRYEQLFVQPDWGAVEVAPPTLTFDDRVTLWVGGRRVEVIRCPYVAHTTGDVVVWIPETGVLYAGDLLFNQTTPFVAFGSLAGSIASLDWLRSFEPRSIVPGHGPMATAADLDEPESYLLMVADEAAKAYEAGLTTLEAARLVDLGRFEEWPDAERIVGNLQRGIAEAGGHAEVSVDVGALVGDTLAYRNGQLIPTRA